MHRDGGDAAGNVHPTAAVGLAVRHRPWPQRPPLRAGRRWRAGRCATPHRRVGVLFGNLGTLRCLVLPPRRRRAGRVGFQRPRMRGRAEVRAGSLHRFARLLRHLGLNRSIRQFVQSAAFHMRYQAHQRLAARRAGWYVRAFRCSRLLNFVDPVVNGCSHGSLSPQ